MLHLESVFHLWVPFYRIRVFFLKAQCFSSLLSWTHIDTIAIRTRIFTSHLVRHCGRPYVLLSHDVTAAILGIKTIKMAAMISQLRVAALVSWGANRGLMRLLERLGGIVILCQWYKSHRLPESNIALIVFFHRWKVFLFLLQIYQEGSFSVNYSTLLLPRFHQAFSLLSVIRFVWDWFW